MAFIKHILGTGGGKETGSFSNYSIREHIRPGKKVIYTPFFKRDTRPEILDEFTRNGYRIIKTMHYEGNPFPGTERDLGYYLEESIVDDERKHDTLARRAQVEQPKEYKFPDILSLNKPIVVKYPLSDRGESVFLLDSQENIAKFLVYAQEQVTSSLERNKDKNLIAQAKQEIQDGNLPQSRFD